MESTKTTRTTHQKKFVADFLHTTHSHPTAYDVVDAAKRHGVTLSVTTAYRLLNQMVADGQAISLAGKDGQLHFDCLRNDHIHFVCEKCGKINDVFLDQNEAISFCEKRGMGVSHIQQIVVYGVCQSCQAKAK